MPVERQSKWNFSPAVQMVSWHADGSGWKPPSNSTEKNDGEAGPWMLVFQVPRRRCWRGRNEGVGLGREECQEQVTVLKWLQGMKQTTVRRDWGHTDQSYAVLNQLRSSLCCWPTPGYVRLICSYPPVSQTLLQPQSTSLDCQAHLSRIIRQ